MKKSLLILSLLALTATSARAFDTLERGTADSPNYYLIKSNSGRYVSYSADEISVSSSVTHLEVVDSPAYSQQASAKLVTKFVKNHSWGFKI